MKRIAWLCLAFAVAVLSSRLSAQTDVPNVPNFTGTWVQNMEKSWAPKGSTLQGYTNEVEQAGDNLKVVTILRRGGQDTRAERKYVIGKEELGSGPGDVAIPFRVKWEGRVLVFEVSNPFTADGDGRESWTLSDDGKVLTKVREVPSPQGKQTQTFILEKR